MKKSISQRGNRGIAPASWKIAAALQQSAKVEMAWGNCESESNMEHHLREKHREDLMT